MLAAAPLLAALVALAPESGAERVTAEASLAVEVLVPPAKKEPRNHVGYEVAVSASVRAGSSFKAMLGLSAGHVVHGWLGDPTGARAVRGGRWAGTQPRSFRGQLLRIAPLIRVGIENDFAYGYLGAALGYAIRTASLACTVGACGTKRAVDHGLNLAVSLGALLAPLQSLGFVVGAEVGLDWAWFPQGHPGLAQWSQGMSARLITGWQF